MKFYHFNSTRTKALNNFAKNLKENYNNEAQCEIFYMDYLDFLSNFIRIILKKDFWIFNYLENSYYSYYKYNIKKTFIRYPQIYKYSIFKNILYLIFEIRTHLVKCFVLLKFNNKSPGTILIWNGALLPQSLLKAFAKKNKFNTMFFEIAHFPNKIQFDNQGINYYSSLPQNPEFYLNYNFKFNEILPEKIGIRKNKLKSDGIKVIKPENYVFVVFQVPSDSQILDLSPWISDMFHFYQVLLEVTESLNDINFVIKEHPSFKLKIKDKVKPHPRIIFDNWGDTEELIKNSEMVLTVNSTAGLEALVFEKKVITLGLANYNIEGLVLNCKNIDELIANLEQRYSWNFDQNLRQQFLKYYYNKYLVSGTYSDIDRNIFENLKIRSSNRFNTLVYEQSKNLIGLQTWSDFPF